MGSEHCVEPLLLKKTKFFATWPLSIYMKCTMRIIFFTLGWGFFALGLIGAFLPVLPTTPFMLLALIMFAKSSERFHQWLYHHRIFGPPLQKWHEHRVISSKAKIMSISMMSLSLLYVIFFSPIPVWMMILTGLLMGYGAWFILTKPSHASK